MAQAIPAILAVGGAGLKAAGSIIGANAQAKDLRFQADQLDAQAGMERASSQRQAIDERRQATLAESRGLALAAASGGGADDPTVVNAIAGIHGEGEYRALTAMYNGEERARSDEAQAAAKRSGAKSVKTAGVLDAMGTILSAGTSLYDRYGGGGGGATAVRADSMGGTLASGAGIGSYTTPVDPYAGLGKRAYKATKVLNGEGWSAPTLSMAKG